MGTHQPEHGKTPAGSWSRARSLCPHGGEASPQTLGFGSGGRQLVLAPTGQGLLVGEMRPQSQDLSVARDVARDVSGLGTPSYGDEV